MTPYGHKLSFALNLERERMLNEWFFKWHYIGRGNSIEIDSFDGRLISYGGIKFDGTARDVYWHTLQRYIRLKIDQEFAALEGAIASYPHSAALEAVDDAESAINAFISQIARDAVEKDRILRGNGFEFPPHDNSKRGLLLSRSDVGERASALRRHLVLVNDTQSVSKQGEQQIFTLKPTLWGIGVDLKAVWKRILSRKNERGSARSDSP